MCRRETRRPPDPERSDGEAVAGVESLPLRVRGGRLRLRARHLGEPGRRGVRATAAKVRLAVAPPAGSRRDGGEAEEAMREASNCVKCRLPPRTDAWGGRPSGFGRQTSSSVMCASRSVAALSAAEGGKGEPGAGPKISLTQRLCGRRYMLEEFSRGRKGQGAGGCRGVQLALTRPLLHART